MDETLKIIKDLTDCQSPSDIYKKLRMTEGTKYENQVYTIKKVLNKMKKLIEKVPENKKSKIEENEKIINIVGNILYFNQSGQGLKILTQTKCFIDNQLL